MDSLECHDGQPRQIGWIWGILEKIKPSIMKMSLLYLKMGKRWGAKFCYVENFIFNWFPINLKLNMQIHWYNELSWGENIYTSES